MSTYGIGKEHHENLWRSLFRQLLAHNYLTTDREGYGSLVLTPLATPLLKGECELKLRKDDYSKVKATSTARSKRKGAEPARNLAINSDLLEQLKNLRSEIAKKSKKPPYIIFHNSTLEDMAANKPKDNEQLQLISGVGENKLRLYGKQFLEVINEF